jgi:hypothetical protein
MDRLLDPGGPALKTTLRAASAVVALALAAPAVAQQASAPSPRLGIGISFNPTVLTDVVSTTSGAVTPTPKLYVPFYVAPNIRLEPEIGWLSVTNDNTSTNDHAFDLGIGALVLKPVAQSTNIYGGLRLASIWVQSQTPTQRITQRNTVLTFAGGAEYLPIAWFSVGVEGQLAFTFFGDEEVNTNGIVTNGRGGNAKAIQGLFFMWVYFL